MDATNLIYSSPDENVKLIVDVMRKMLTPVIEGAVKTKSLDTSKRIGLGKAIINDPEDFDVWNTMSWSCFPIKIFLFFKQQKSFLAFL